MRYYEVSDTAPSAAALAAQETLFHTANGYLGVRGTLEEGLPAGADTMRGMYINGFYDVIPMKQAEPLYGLPEEKETMLNVADAQTITLDFGGEVFSLFSGRLLSFCRRLDMDAGTAERAVVWRSPSGREAEIRFRRMASFAEPHLFTIDLTVTPLNFSGSVAVRCTQEGLVRNYSGTGDPRLGGESRLLLAPAGHSVQDGAHYLCTRTAASGLTVCCGVRQDSPAAEPESAVYDAAAHRVEWTYSLPLAKGRAARFTQYVVLTDSVREQDPEAAAKAVMTRCFGRMEALYEAQRAYLAEFWAQSEMAVEGDERTDRAICFNLYQLLQSAGKDGLCSIAAKGLSGEGYEGHYFWDTEMYMMPFFTLTNPAIARALLHYRWSILGAAKANAQMLGHKSGALFPWRTITGRECSGYFPSGTAQYHINADIAYAAAAYWLATGDTAYLAEEGAELLVETARLWLDVGCWYDGRFHIYDVTGPDEYSCIVNDNYYTNAGAQYNMRWALRAVALLREAGGYADTLARIGLTQKEADAMAGAADAMCLPYDETLGILAQDDSFLHKPLWDMAATPPENHPLLLHYHPLELYRHQVCKQADAVLALFTYEPLQSREVAARTFDYYEKVTTHDSSLSTCIFSIVASALGRTEKAWSYFGNCAVTDLENTQGNTKDGLHTANMGGCYMAIVYGFAGLRIHEDGVCFAPALPAAWKGYRFRLCWHGSVLQFAMDKAGCTVTLVHGANVPVTLGGHSALLKAAGDALTE